jgi:Protein of unknown function (DUF3421)
VGGYFGDEPLYIGRALHNGALTPGNDLELPGVFSSIIFHSWLLGTVLPSENVLYIAWGFKCHKKTDFEILIGGARDNWVAASGGNIPENAFVAGHTEHGEATFIGRVKVAEGKFLIGKIHPSYKTCYIPDVKGTKELEFGKYEVFVV